jgi:hypothetical protein
VLGGDAGLGTKLLALGWVLGKGEERGGEGKDWGGEGEGEGRRGRSGKVVGSGVGVREGREKEGGRRKKEGGRRKKEGRKRREGPYLFIIIGIRQNLLPQHSSRLLPQKRGIILQRGITIIKKIHHVVYRVQPVRIRNFNARVL